MKDKDKDQDKILIGFFPVIHQGYLDLLEDFKDKEIYYFSEHLLEKWERFDHLKRDLRFKDISLIPNILKKAGIIKDAAEITEENIDEIKNFNGKIIMPDEDVSQWFSEKYLFDSNKDIEFKNIFLRADQKRVKKMTEGDFVDPDEEVTEEGMHQDFMKKAIDLTQKSPDWWRQIASVAVSDGKIIASACNHGLPNDLQTSVFGDPRSQFDAGENIEVCSCIHSEASVVAQVAKEKDLSLDGADIYVSTFPCPVCAKLLSETGIKRVFYKEGYSKGEGKEVLKSAGIKLIRVK
jgi:dCMP deaminase